MSKISKIGIKDAIISITKIEEADLLNVALFNCTAKDWRELNPEQAKKSLNIRDFASINELAVLSNVESLNAELIKKGIEKADRFIQLRKMAIYQLEILDKKNAIKAMKKLADDIYIEQQKKLVLPRTRVQYVFSV